MHVTGHAASKEIIGDGLLGVKTPTSALVFRCAPASSLPPSHSSCNGGSVDSGNTHPRPAAPRRVVEQYLWHEKTKGRKHKMQIHTYHKVSERRPRSHPSATSAAVAVAVAVAAAAAVPAAAAAAEKPCAPRRGRRGSSTRQSSWTMVHM